MLEGAADVCDRWSGGARVVVVAIDAERRCEFDGGVSVAFNESLSKQEMLEWLVVKIDELLAISMRVAVAMESIAASLEHLAND